MKTSGIEIDDFQRIVLRNQRYIMLGLVQTLAGLYSGNVLAKEKLLERVKLMEQRFDWIAAPSERLE